jgi:pimeloyl-ACP methyl ester carboxylesterase
MSKSEETLITGHIDLGSSKLYYETIGTGYPLVLIHDGLVDCRVWDEQILFFAEQYQVIRYDRRGYGRSEPPAEDYSNVEDLHTLLQFLEIENASLMGVSAGGMIAIDFTLSYPEMVDAMVLIGAYVDGFKSSEHMRKRGMAAAGPLIENDDVDQTIENWVNDPYFVAAENTTARKKFREFLTSYPHNLYKPHAYSFDEPGPPAVGRLSEINVPTLIIVGEEDIADNHAVSGVLQIGIKGSKRVIYPNAGHLVNLEQPKIFNQSVLEFLESAF